MSAALKRDAAAVKFPNERMGASIGRSAHLDVPVLLFYVLFQKQIAGGITAGAVK
ncbi:hypothetical protein [Paenibacillus rigui]|uniref:hypothetical protein n=1 Tax=Paenibacillus rigui TaxID=554312 RepID=UPI001FE6EEDE|nr:hypothetical protein [Paenibacillus rigui]